ncbi:hypothetical protein B0A55_00927 [Friedmanniomyces simplex]|uniref:Extracellular membrane protein CFEM domain-containing protein n=1 Tax=Friedmanniomyces simplex TaxID=329884 RepID=A0A4U0Y4D9_9PEZI|nr:hypothetical protein B0A55_00927 [Friedmanniomyces simplex]
MFSTKTLLTALVAATFAEQTIAYSNPACWSSCFTQYNVTQEGSLCDASLGSVVGSCIASGCAAANSTASIAQYGAWLCEYCHENSTACSVSSSSSTTLTIATTSSTASTITTSALSATSAVPTSSGAPLNNYNGTTPTQSYPAGPTGGNHSASTSAPIPYTGGASGLAATGSMVALLGMLAVAFLS